MLQVTLADVEEAATPQKRFDPEPSSPSHGSEDSWHDLDPPHLLPAAPPPHAHAFPYIVQPFDHAQAGGPQGAVQALNSRLQHGMLDAHARQRAMRRDMRAATTEHQASHAVAPIELPQQHAAFPGPPPPPLPAPGQRHLCFNPACHNESVSILMAVQILSFSGPPTPRFPTRGGDCPCFTLAYASFCD